MAARNIRNVEMTNLGKMIRYDFLEISAHDAEMIQVAEYFQPRASYLANDR